MIDIHRFHSAINWIESSILHGNTFAFDKVSYAMHSKIKLILNRVEIKWKHCICILKEFKIQKLMINNSGKKTSEKPNMEAESAI